MKKSTSSLAAVVLGSLLAVGATTASMARDVAGHRTAGSHRIGHGLRCNDDSGFGGFSGAPGHPFIGPSNCGKDWNEDDWEEDDPLWSPEIRQSVDMATRPTLSRLGTYTAQASLSDAADL